MVHRFITGLGRWRKLALCCVAALLLVAGASALFLGTDTGQQFLLRRIQAAAARAGHSFTAQHLEIHPLDLAVHLSGFVYDNAGIRVEADELGVDAPRTFYRNEGIVLDALEANGLRITISSPEPVIPEPSGETTALPRVTVGRISIRNGRFSYTNQSTKVEVPSFSLEATAGQGTLRLREPVTISPDMAFNVEEIPLQLSSTSLLYGPIQWSGAYIERRASGSASGRLDWSPQIAVDTKFATDAVTIEKWDGVVARGLARYKDGKLHIEDFRATRGRGELAASAIISDQNKSAALVWKSVRLDPAGLQGETDGRLDLDWKLSDFSDINGRGRVGVTTREYGTALSDVEIVKGRARLNIRGSSAGVSVEAVVNTGWNRSLSGTFNATYPQYGAVTARGTLAGTLTAPRVEAKVVAAGVSYKGFGPLSGTANASYRNNIVDLSDLMAQLGRSVVPTAQLRVDLKSRTINGSVPQILAELGDFVDHASGQIQSSASISGSLDRPTADFVASSAGLDIEGTHIDSANAVATLAQDILQVTQLTARQKEGMLDASGTVNLSTEQVEAVAKVSNLQINQIREVSATVNLDVRVSGSYRQPAAKVDGELTHVVYSGQEHGTLALKGTSTKDAAQLRLESEKYSALAEGTVAFTPPYAFSATVSAKDSSLDYREYHFTAGGQIQGAGTVSPVAVNSLQLGDVTVAGKGVDLKANGSLDTGVKVDMSAKLSELPAGNIELSGDAQIEAVVYGPIKSPRVEGNLQTTNATVRTAAMAEPATVETAVDFTLDRFTIRAMTATYEEARVAITGNGTLHGSGEFAFKAENIRPERFVMDRPVAGLLGIAGDIRVTAPRLDSIEGQATVTQLELRVQGVEVHQTGQGEIRLQNQVISIQDFGLEGPETRASAAGTVSLSSGEIALDVDANTDLRILEGFMPRTTVFGRVESQVVVRGNTKQPDMKGFINVDDAEIQMTAPSLYLAGVNARMSLAENRLQIESAGGSINNGTFELSGTTGISSQGLQDADILLQLKDATLEYPAGLQTGFSADLALTGTSPNAYLVGDVNVLDALYRENIDLRGQLFSRLTPAAQPAFVTPSASGLAQAINLDINVDTSGPVSVSNNLARMDLFGSFRVRGKIDDPIILGRADALEGGEVYFGPSEGGEAAAIRERRDRYIIQRGVLEFNNPLSTEPTVDFEATHDLRVRDERYAIRLTARGTPTDLVTELTSDPYLSEPDIVSMLLTGRTFADLQGAQVAVAREQLLDYVSGQLTSRFFLGAGAAIGLDTVTIEPATGAAEDDVSARLTVGKDISKDLSLVYAQNLAGPRNQSWILNYSTVKDFVVRAINRPDQEEIRFEFRHGFELGGGPPLPRRVTPRAEPQLGNVNFSMTALSEEELRGKVAKPMSPYSVHRMSEDTHALVNLFADKGYPDIKIRPTRQVNGDFTDVRFNIDQGPKTTFDYRGPNADVPDEVRKELLQVWIDGRAEATSREESIAVLLRHFRDDGYLNARVSVTNESQNPQERVYVFQIETGKKYPHPKWVFQGIEPMEVTESPGTVIAKPELVQGRMESSLREKGFLDAKVGLPQLDMNGDTPHFVVTVDRGKQYGVGNVNYEGNTFFTDTHLSGVVILGPTRVIPSDQAGGTRPPENEKQLLPFPYNSDWITIARRRIMTEYWQQGFNDVQIAPSTHYEPGSGVIDVTFDIKEGDEQRIASIRVMGDQRTLSRHVRRYFKIFEGDPVDHSRISLTRKRLYDTGLFKRVDIQIVKEPEGNVADVNLNERAPWSIKYGFTITDRQEQDTRDRDLGVSTELTHRNLFGVGITSGVSFKIDTTLREARLFSSFPVFLNRDITTTFSLFRSREALPDVVTKTTGFTVKQQRRLRDFYLLSYDYAYRRVGNREIDKVEDDPEIVDGIVPVARLNGTLTRDTRDDIFNATRGTFFSSSLDFAPPGIGSSVRYVRNYTQYLRFRQVRPNLIWASAYRLGLARGFGGSNLVPSDRFTAGGPTSLRAFRQDRATQQPGNVLIVTNQELRYPLFWKLGVVGFFDVGNVYEGLGSAKVLQQRYSPGIGIRIDTPFVLLRVDLGLNLWPRTGEDRRRISFGIGQAF